MPDFPIQRRKRAPKDYRGPKCKPGQTPMLCPVERAYRAFAFTPDDRLRCTSCGFTIAREETV
jgi:hypothetical protein